MLTKLRNTISRWPWQAQVAAWPLYGVLHTTVWISSFYTRGVEAGVKGGLRRTKQRLRLKKKKKRS